ERAFDRLPEIASLLERAGCREAELLAHCRAPGEHFRGCWVLDLIMGQWLPLRIGPLSEAEWLAHTGDPWEMLRFLRGAATARQLGRFARECCRGVWDLLEEPARALVETAERYAGGRASATELEAARAAVPVRVASDGTDDPFNITAWAAEAALHAVHL